MKLQTLLRHFFLLLAVLGSVATPALAEPDEQALGKAPGYPLGSTSTTGMPCRIAWLPGPHWTKCPAS